MKIVLNVQKLYALIVAYMLSFLGLLSLGNAILNMVGIYTALDTVLLYSLMVGLIGLGVLVSVIEGRWLRLDDLLVMVFFAVSFAVSGLVNPENKAHLFTSWLDYSKNPVYVVFLYSLPGFYFARRLENYDYFKKVMTGCSYAVVIMSVIVYFGAKESSARQYMTFSYNMLTQLLFLCIYPPKRHKLLYSVILASGLFVFIVGGARGAMISLIISIAILSVYRTETVRKKLWQGAAILVIGVTFAFLKNTVFLFLGDVLDRLSIDSRTFQFMIQGEFFNDSYRLQIYRNAVEIIGFFGLGMKGDRVLLSSYPHNLFLELCCQFGLIAGIILSIAICACIVAGLRRKNRAEWLWIIMLLPCGFIKLTMTGSYINQEPAFYVLLGLCLNSILRGRNNAGSDG